MSWTDPRLAWDPAAYGGITQTHFNGDFWNADAAIWVPDLQPYNTMEGIASTLEATMATVSSDGAVFYSRPGMLVLMCKYSGLVAFPYDRLKCSFELGGWSWDGTQQNMTLRNGGYSFSAQEVTSGSSYEEYTLDPNPEVTLHTYYYSGTPWPVALYTLAFERATTHPTVPCQPLPCQPIPAMPYHAIPCRLISSHLILGIPSSSTVPPSTMSS
jgi:hypothetical protein